MKIRKAKLSDWQGIQKVCQTGWQTTYEGLYSQAYIDKVCEDFYGEARLRKDLTETSSAWHGYWVAALDDQIVGCIGGGLDGNGRAHVYVLYVLPDFQRLGVGHTLLDELTRYQKETYGATEQGVTATKGNLKGIPFYEKEGFVFQEEVVNWNEASETPDCHYLRRI